MRKTMVQLKEKKNKLCTIFYVDSSESLPTLE